MRNLLGVACGIMVVNQLVCARGAHHLPQQLLSTDGSARDGCVCVCLLQNVGAGPLGRMAILQCSEHW